MLLVQTGFFPREVEFDAKMLATVFDVMEKGK